MKMHFSTRECGAQHQWYIFRFLGVLYICTSKWVLLTTFAGWNNLEWTPNEPAVGSKAAFGSSPFSPLVASFCAEKLQNNTKYCKKDLNCIFRSVFWVRSTQTLFKIYNNPHSCSIGPTTSRPSLSKLQNDVTNQAASSAAWSFC